MIVHHVHGRRVQLLLLAVLLVTILVVVWSSLGVDAGPEVLPPQPRLTRQLRASCQLLLRPDHDLPAVERERMSWVCSRVGALLPWPRDLGCGRQATYAPGDGLESNLLRYAVLYGLARLLHAEAQVEPAVLTGLRSVFPGLTLPPAPDSQRWQPVAYWPALTMVRCRPGEVSGQSEPQRYRLEGPPDGSAVRLFSPFERSLRRELKLSDTLRRGAESALQTALGQRVSATYIGLLLPAQDSRHRPLPPGYLLNSMDHYRRRFSDALFIVVAPDASVTSLPPLAYRSDVVAVPAAVARDPALSLAVRAACNHSIVTGDEGFWGAFLAGGEVTVPPPEPSDVQGYGWLMLTSQMSDDKRWTVVT